MKKGTKTAIFDTAVAREKIEQGKRRKWWRRKGGKSSGFRYLDQD
jgi:hypothetical protein